MQALWWVCLSRHVRHIPSPRLISWLDQKIAETRGSPASITPV